ncbi:MAG: Ni/Fe-hydrogenase cytochrome b subunit [candidate division KSB1 bacterium]|nr:Ni/Fe-hydrogenase cytochrome b subunit [candidate division KSB1 bacterium]
MGRSRIWSQLPRLTFWKAVLVLLWVVGAYVAVVRFTKGLGAVTNLRDDFPWGLWIGFDVLCGVALAAGGFTVAALVYIFDAGKKYHAITRPTILTAFLGYLLVIVALLFDLGRPWNIWHPIIMWNHHSVMFEVAWCVMLYTAVLALEFSPVVFERLNWQAPLRLIRSLTIVLVVAGVLLSTLHQSSLGSLYLIVPQKMHPLWYSPWLPLLFFISAVGVGLAMTIFESFLSHRAFRRELELDVLTGLARGVILVQAIYLTLRFLDLANRGVIGHAFQPSREAGLFWLETLLMSGVPMVLYSMPKLVVQRNWLFYGAVCNVLGLVMNRLNVSITALERWGGAYFPKWQEIVITATLVATGFFVFEWVAKNFPVFPREMAAEEAGGRAEGEVSYAQAM